MQLWLSVCLSQDPMSKYVAMSKSSGGSDLYMVIDSFNRLGSTDAKVKEFVRGIEFGSGEKQINDYGPVRADVQGRVTRGMVERMSRGPFCR